MTHEQFLSMAVLAVTLGLFIWDRLRYDVVALISLLAAIVTGVVPMAKAFTGFSDQIVIVVASALIISKALSLSGTVERLLEPLAHRLTTTTRQAAVLVGAVTALSAFMKNIGALAIFMPVALQFSRRIKASPSRLMMPLAFGSLLGGVMTLIGTSPNIIVSRVREDLTGHPFSMFDFFPVGAGIAVTGLIFLIFGWRLLPERRSPTSSAEGELHIRDYLTEVRMLPNSPLIDWHRRRSGGPVGRRRHGRGPDPRQGPEYIPGEHWRLFQDDIIIVETDPENLKKLLAAGKLEIATGSSTAKDGRHGAVGRAGPDGNGGGAIVAADRLPIKDFRLRSRFGVNVLALGRAAASL